MSALSPKIAIIEHRSRHTKKVSCTGPLQVTYRRAPKTLRFSSPMVNDENQDLSGGWPRDRRVNLGEIALQRVIGAVKPFAFVQTFRTEEHSRWIEAAEVADLPRTAYERQWESTIG